MPIVSLLTRWRPIAHASPPGPRHLRPQAERKPFARELDQLG
jgi:hypothetical protein